MPVDVRTTFLGAHACRRNSPAAPTTTSTKCCACCRRCTREGLVDAVDAFCERIAFSPAQTERVFEAARALGLPVKLHAEQLSDSGGAALAARYGALSAATTWSICRPTGVRARWPRPARVAVLLPGAFYFLRETQLPPVEPLRDAGVPIAHGHRLQPGHLAVLSLLLMLNMACTLFRLTPEEALAGVTVHARARAGPGRPRRAAAGPARRLRGLGRWSTRASWPTAFGHNPCRRIVVGGRIDRMNDTVYTCSTAQPLLVSLPHVGTRHPRGSPRRC